MVVNLGSIWHHLSRPLLICPSKSEGMDNRDVSVGGAWNLRIARCVGWIPVRSIAEWTLIQSGVAWQQVGDAPVWATVSDLWFDPSDGLYIFFRSTVI